MLGSECRCQQLSFEVHTTDGRIWHEFFGCEYWVASENLERTPLRLRTYLKKAVAGYRETRSVEEHQLLML
jgi:hypothetical protein